MSAKVTASVEVTKLRNARKASLAAVVATSLEWYDFFIYSTAAALVFNLTFFATEDPVVAAANSFSTVAVGFIARPLGGILAGHYGDKFGRKPVLVTAIILMALATTLIGFVPSTQIAWLAPTMLIALRLCQGLAVGAQWGGAALLAAEYAPANRRGFYGSFTQVGVPIGVILGNVAFLAVTSWSSSEAFISWGWRIPFWISLLMLPLAFMIHRYMEDTPEFQELAAKAAAQPRSKSPILHVLAKHWQTVLLSGFANVIGTVVFYLTITGSLQFVTAQGMSRSLALAVILSAYFVHIFLTLFWALVSDKVGRKKIFGAGILAMGLWGIPMWLLIAQSSNDKVWLFVVAIVGSVMVQAPMSGTQATLFAELFPAEVRFSGAALGYQISSVIAGFAPMLMVILIGGDPANAWRVGLMVLIVALLGFLSLLVISHRYGTDHMKAADRARMAEHESDPMSAVPNGDAVADSDLQ